MNSRTGPHSNRTPIMLSYYNTQSVIQSATVTRANNSSAISCSNSVTQRPLVTAHQLILRKRRLRNLRGKLSQHPLIAYLIPVTRCKNNSRGLLCRSVDIGRLSSPVSMKGTGPKMVPHLTIQNFRQPNKLYRYFLPKCFVRGP